ncbi:hypothetical protein B0H11DRAFT_1922357 [Mycena galericulata]|nr:hypothetical protein B0H11DRAFT_1922357 [Mycena galericulata]
MYKADSAQHNPDAAPSMLSKSSHKTNIPATTPKPEDQQATDPITVETVPRKERGLKRKRSDSGNDSVYDTGPFKRKRGAARWAIHKKRQAVLEVSHRQSGGEQIVKGSQEKTLDQITHNVGDDHQMDGCKNPNRPRTIPPHTRSHKVGPPPTPPGAPGPRLAHRGFSASVPDSEDLFACIAPLKGDVTREAFEVYEKACNEPCKIRKARGDHQAEEGIAVRGLVVVETCRTTSQALGLTEFLRKVGPLRTKLACVRAQLEDLEFQINAKSRELELLQVDNNKIIAQVHARTLRCQSVQEELELLNVHGRAMLEEVDLCLAKKLASVGRRNAVAKNIEWIRDKILTTEHPSPAMESGFRSRNRELATEVGIPLFANFLYLIGIPVRPDFEPKRFTIVTGTSLTTLYAQLVHMRETVLKEEKVEHGTTYTSLLENEKVRLQSLFDKALSTKKELEEASQALTSQANGGRVRYQNEHEPSASKYFYEFKAAAEKRLELYNQGLRLKLISVEGDVLRIQNQVQMVNYDIESIRAQADFVVREGKAREEYFLADLKFLSEQLEMYRFT